MTGIRTIGLAAMLAIVALPTLADAQSRTGTRLGSAPASVRDGDLTRTEKARLATMEFAECLYEEKRLAGLGDYLQTLTYSSAADAELEALLLDRCLATGELTVTDDLLRGALYEVVYKKNGKVRKLKDFSQTPAVDYGSVDDVSNDRVVSGIRFREFADCVVRSDTDASRKLVKSRLLSNSEERAFDDLREASGDCLMAGSRLQFSMPIMRGLIAEALYRLAMTEADRLEGMES